MFGSDRRRRRKPVPGALRSLGVSCHSSHCSPVFLSSEGGLAVENLGIRLLVIAAFVLLTALPVHAGYLDLAWDPPTTRVDGTALNDLAGYRVYFGTSSPVCLGSTYQDVLSPTPAPSTGDVVEFRLEGLESGIPYYVQVSAFDQTGNESFCSNEVTAAANAGGASGSGGGGGAEGLFHCHGGIRLRAGAAGPSSGSSGTGTCFRMRQGERS